MASNGTEQCNHDIVRLQEAINCQGTREFIFALDAFMRNVSEEIQRQGTPQEK